VTAVAVDKLGQKEIWKMCVGNNSYIPLFNIPCRGSINACVLCMLNRCFHKIWRFQSSRVVFDGPRKRGGDRIIGGTL